MCARVCWYIDKIRYCLLCNVRPPAQNTNSYYNKKKSKDVEKTYNT